MIVWWDDAGQSEPIQPAASNLQEMDTFASAFLQSASQKRKQHLVPTAKRLKINQTNALQTARSVPPVENCNGKYMRLIVGGEDP